MGQLTDAETSSLESSFKSGKGNFERSAVSLNDMAVRDTIDGVILFAKMGCGITPQKGRKYLVPSSADQRSGA